MRTHRLISFTMFLIVSLCFIAPALAGESLRELARGAVAESAEERAASIAALRAKGQAGLEALFEEFDEAIRSHLAASSVAAPESAEWERIAAALDAVSQQKDSYTARLYWHTDIEEAKLEARATGKPILSLRLLGKLSDEYSCANSRFFRTALYSNSSVSKYLREHFVLHWKSVRPAPVVTVDYGDGRKLVRTITGNSIHYVLDSEGRTVDALPGLYGPQAFMYELERAEGAARQSTRIESSGREMFLSGYYNARSLELIRNLQADAKRAGVVLPEGTILRGGSSSTLINLPPTALVVAPLAVTKSAVEISTVRSITYTPTTLQRSLDDAAWADIADLHKSEARMDAASIALLARHNPYINSPSQVGAARTPAELARVVSNFELRMALDTVRNQYLMRPILLRWLNEGAWRDDVEKLNARVYAELFLTPDSDPWLGLLTPDTYTGIRNDGVVLNK